MSVRLKKTRLQKWARNIPLIEDPLKESVFFLCLGGVNPLHPNISINILHTVLYTLPKRPTMRIYLTIKSCSSW